jgi:hypothetical protein
MKTPQEELHYLGLMLTATDIDDYNRISAICARIKELTE